MPILLHIETATPNCSVALSQNGELLALTEASADKYLHAEKLHEFIAYSIEKSGVDSSKIEGVTVSAGPGSYTGLRIGVAAAKGLCFAWGVPLIPLLTNRILAAHALQNFPNHCIVALTDARRMEAYVTVFNSAGLELQPTQAIVLEPSTFDSWQSDKPFVFIGDGAQKYEAVYEGAPALFVQTFPSAQFMVRPGEEAFLKQEFADVAYYEPFYLKTFVAGPRKRIF